MENYKIYNYSCRIEKIDMSEVYRYMGSGDDASELVGELLDVILSKLNPKAVYMFAPVECEKDVVNFGLFSCGSKALAKNLDGCTQAVIFGATIGFGADREIMKYSSVSPVKALAAQAIGTVLVEQLCDNLCAEISKSFDTALNPRFSPGYADLGLEVQKELFSVLNLPKNCGISLTESLIMRPSKSVTAIAGIRKDGGGACKKGIKCSMCSKTDCAYRR